MDLRISIIYHGFKNLRKISWVSKPPSSTMSLKTSVKYHGFKNLHKIP